MPSKFVKKPVVIEAMQIPVRRDDSQELDVFLWLAKYLPIVAPSASYPDTESYPTEGVSVCYEEKYLEIFTLEGVMRARASDWIIRGVNGEFYPCKDDIFRKTYDPYIERSEVA